MATNTLKYLLYVYSDPGIGLLTPKNPQIDPKCVKIGQQMAEIETFLFFKVGVKQVLLLL